MADSVNAEEEEAIALLWYLVLQICVPVAVVSCDDF
jgi:hypothetical protein